MTRYSLELINLKDKNPEIYKMLVNGVFSVRRTDTTFSRVGVDIIIIIINLFSKKTYINLNTLISTSYTFTHTK